MLHPRNLVFNGGGSKVAFSVGAYIQLEAMGFADKLERVAGASAGAILALLIALGYSKEEIYTKLLSLDIDKMKDESY